MSSARYKISFCIVCMNRLHQLKETLLTNISDNSDYKNLEFILLDYNSGDGLERWVKEHLTGFISSGLLVYYRTYEPEKFNHSHSKNMAFNLATGDIVCNINADHYTGPGFAAYVNNCFSNKPGSVLTTIDYYNIRADYKPARDLYGKVCVKKSDFLKAGGFDEQMVNYGFEDWDFVNRLELAGLNRVFIDDPSFLKFTVHDQAERYQLPDHQLTVHVLYIHYITPAESEILILYKNGRFGKGILLDNSVSHSNDCRFAYQSRNCRFENSIKDNFWVTGSWAWSEDIHCCELILPGGTKILLAGSDDNSLINETGSARYYRIRDGQIINDIMEFLFIYENRRLMERNLENSVLRVNQGKWGSGKTYKNFEGALV